MPGETETSARIWTCIMIAVVYAYINLILTQFTVKSRESIFFLTVVIVLSCVCTWFFIKFVSFLLHCLFLLLCYLFSLPYYLCIFLWTLINKFFQVLYYVCFSGVSSVITFIKSIILFVLHVPIEYTAGILVALSLAYIFHHHKHRALQQQQTIQNLSIRVRGSSRPVEQDDIPVDSPTEQPNVPITSSSLTDKHCVVCLQRDKCILLLPCKHLCICSECASKLKCYRQNCPVCRTKIDNTMKIYI